MQICEVCKTRLVKKARESRSQFESKRFCCYKCYWESLKEIEPWNKGELVTKRCIFCDTAFDVAPSRADSAKFCSHRCFSNHRKETGSLRGDNHPNWGKGNPWTRGEKNPNWRGGVSKANKNRWSDNEYLHWRRAVFHRDNYACQECGKRGVYLEAHHIRPWRSHPDLRYEVRNGITYCKECHILLDEFRRG